MIKNDEYFLNIAWAVAEGADCTRRKIGAVIVDEDKHIIATGCNRALDGETGCEAGGCPRGRHWLRYVHKYPELHGCNCGNSWPCPDSPTNNEPPYTDCISIHAEVDALLEHGRYTNRGCTLYCTNEPCSDCMKVIWSAGITAVITSSKVIMPHMSYDRTSV